VPLLCNAPLAPLSINYMINFWNTGVEKSQVSDNIVRSLLLPLVISAFLLKYHKNVGINTDCIVRSILNLVLS
jgi:hypothetical protein